MKNFKRLDRLSKQILRELSCLARKELIDPRIQLISITKITLNRDLSYAKVYISLVSGNNSDKTECVALLNKLSSFLRWKLGKKIFIRSLPKLEFIYDNSLEKESDFLELLNLLVS